MVTHSTGVSPNTDSGLVKPFDFPEGTALVRVCMCFSGGMVFLLFSLLNDCGCSNAISLFKRLM